MLDELRKVRIIKRNGQFQIVAFNDTMYAKDPSIITYMPKTIYSQWVRLYSDWITMQIDLQEFFLGIDHTEGMECYSCGKDIRFSDSCAERPYVFPDGHYEPIRAGDESFVMRPYDHCPSCGIITGATHHTGCEVEQCPRCGEKAYLCPCFKAQAA